MFKFLLKGGLLMSLITATLAGCSSGGGSPDAGIASITVSGIISSSVSSMAVGDVSKMALNLTDLEIYVIYTSGTTVGIAQATVGSDGSWSFSVPAGSQINALVRNKASLELVGPIVFVDSSSTDMDGNAKTSTVTALKSGASLGTITLSSTGKFEVPVTQIAASQDTAVAAPTSKVDFSGAWKISKYDGTLPTGYGTACTAGDNSCHGPQVDENVYLIKLSGKKFTYSGGNCATYASNHTGSCDPDNDGSTVDTAVDAASIWGGATAIAACGYKLGFTRSDAAAFGGVNLVASELPTVNSTQMSFGSVTWSSYGAGWGASIGGTPYSWAYTGATSAYPMMNCTQVEKTASGTTYKINVCKGKLHSNGTTVGYQASYGGGCVTPAGKPVVIKNWAGVNSPSSCDSPTNFAVTGMSVNACSYTGISSTVASDADFKCTYIGGVFDDANLGTPSTLSNGDYVVMDQVSVGASCAGLSADLDKAKCYANYYFSHRPSGVGCEKEYRFNWNATSLGSFVQSDNRDKPKENYLTDVVTYSTDGLSFFLEDHEGDGAQVSTGTGSNAGSTFCRLEKTTMLKGTKVSDAKMLVELNQNMVLVDTLNAACVAAKNDSTSNSGNGSEIYQRINGETQKTLFYLNK